ncbi:MAG: UbiD family decarboxylase [Methanomicrobiales archaeon]|nr:UbiD family decarboxylase [Methanomicrobiales archaeon]
MRELIEALRNEGRLVDIEEECSPHLEAPKIASSSRTAVLFHKIGGARAVMNLISDRSTLARALRLKPEKMAESLSRVRMNGRVVEDGHIAMKNPDLGQIPVMKFFPGEAGPYITAGIVFAALDGVQNASVHRMLLMGRRKVVARLVEGRHTYLMHRKAIERGEVLPVAVAIGVHPAVLFASCTRVPSGMELDYAAELLGGEVRVRECSNGIKVPEAEIVLEGFIGRETAEEGPFVDITGTYDVVRRQPVIEFTGMYLKQDFIYHSILPAGDEHRILMGVPYEPKIFRAVGEVADVRNVVLTRGGCGYFHAVIQIRKLTQGDGKNAIMAAFASHTSLKHVVVVDEDINPFDIEEVEYAIATRVRGDRDILVVTNVRGSSLDPTRLEDGTNVKVGVDATMILGEEAGFRRAGWD